ncbi:MAG: ankyrin repeat domain-containing protein [Gemmataceae bacterium]|nr:ankyrin repeat domain-containing protein [Gemmataceae bacterium]MCI0739553.1 ankyrin repeat domain-containing protein [Gemmataceae bacterium]
MGLAMYCGVLITSMSMALGLCGQGVQQPRALELARKGDVAALEMLLRNNPKLVHQKGDNDLTPLHEAAAEGHESALVLLLEYRAPVNAKTKDGRTALFWAALNGHHRIAQKLILAGSTRDIFSSVCVGDLNHVKDELLANKKLGEASVGKGPTTLLHLAAKFGRQEIIELLIKSELDINVARFGVTPLHLAAEFGHHTVAEMLIRKGAKVDAKEDLEGLTPLHLAVWKNRLRVVRILLENKASVNVRDKYLSTPLHFAITYESSVELVNMLVQFGGDPFAADKNANTPVSIARNSVNRDAYLKLLLGQPN